MDPAIDKADRYYDDYEAGLAAPAARDDEPGAHTQEDGPGSRLASHQTQEGAPATNAGDNGESAGVSLRWTCRLLDFGNRLDYWYRTGDDRAFSAPGPWRSR